MILTDCAFGIAVENDSFEFDEHFRKLVSSGISGTTSSRVDSLLLTSVFLSLLQFSIVYTGQNSSKVPWFDESCVSSRLSEIACKKESEILGGLFLNTNGT